MRFCNILRRVGDWGIALKVWLFKASHQDSELSMSSILVVDDNSIDLKLVCRILRTIDDVTVVPVTSGEAAFRELENQSYDLVLTDLRMPLVDGLMLLRRIRESDLNVPVVIMTAEGSEVLAIEALRSGAANYVAKHEMARDLIPICESLLELAKVQQRRTIVRRAMVSGRTCYHLPSDRCAASQLARHLQNASVAALRCDGGEKTRVGVALEEALLNAVIHGNLEVSSDLRERNDNSYGNLIEKRQQEEPYCSRIVEVEFEWSRERIEIVIRDEGRGFSVADLPDPTDPMNLLKPSGRGVLLMRAFMDEVHYNAKGNEVRLVKHGDAPADSVDGDDFEQDEEILTLALA